MLRAPTPFRSNPFALQSSASPSRPAINPINPREVPSVLLMSFSVIMRIILLNFHKNYNANAETSTILNDWMSAFPKDERLN
jgi:hypothetical protein